MSVSTPAARPQSPPEVQADFRGAAGLTQAVRATPDSRTAMVDRARSLVADPSYPPLETINRIANLLALKISDNQE